MGALYYFSYPGDTSTLALILSAATLILSTAPVILSAATLILSAAKDLGLGRLLLCHLGLLSLSS